MVEGGRQVFDPADPRSAVAQLDDERQRRAYLEKRKQELLAQAGDVVKAAQAEPDMSAGELFKYVSLILGAVTLLVVGVVSPTFFLSSHNYQPQRPLL